MKRESREDWARGILCVQYPNKNCLTRERRDGVTLNPTQIPLLCKSFGLNLTHPNPELAQSSSQKPTWNVSIHMAPCHRPLFPSNLRVLLLPEALASPACPGGAQLLSPLKTIEWIRYQLGKKLYFNLQVVTVVAFWGQDKQIWDLQVSEKNILIGRVQL